jgi:hypothetical protein
MVEISLSGSGEGPGGAIPRGYSTTAISWVVYGSAWTTHEIGGIVRVVDLAIVGAAIGVDRP